jgi:hypothetical protein
MIPPEDGLFKWVKLYHKIRHINVTYQYFNLCIERHFWQPGHSKIGWVLGKSMMQCIRSFLEGKLKWTPLVAAFPAAERVPDAIKAIMHLLDSRAVVE